MNRVLRHLLALYHRTLGRLLGPRCRFHPSCSCYAHTALARHGTVRGSWLTLCRLLRCQPFSQGGLDPVPDLFTWLPRRTREHPRTDDMAPE